MQTLDAKEFVRRLKADFQNDGNSRYGFFLGAGCSRSSGIPTAGELVKDRWLPDLKKLEKGEDDEESIEQWLKARFISYTEDTAALFYGQVMQELFRTSIKRQNEISRLTDGKDPGFGYAVLAQLVSHEFYGNHCNLIFTTNFDDLVADALYLYTNKKPIVISHELLVGFVRRNRIRPLVLKLHGDGMLEPKNTNQEVETLDKALKKTFKNLLSERGLLFIGYGGNDKGILDALKELPDEALSWGLYWINKNKPPDDFEDWLDSRDALWIQNLDFDELMLLTHTEFEFPHPDIRTRLSKLDERYWETFNRLSGKVETRKESKTKSELTSAIEISTSRALGWYAYASEAKKYRVSNPDKFESIMLAGIAKFPKSGPLLTLFGDFLKNYKGDYDESEKYYNLSVESDPSYVHAHLGLGYISLTKGDFVKASKLFIKAIEIDKNSPEALSAYASVLSSEGKLELAEEHYKRALEIDPSNASVLNNYAAYVGEVQGDLNKSRDMLERALVESPDFFILHINYGSLLYMIRKNQEAINHIEKGRSLTRDKNYWIGCDFLIFAHDESKAAVSSALARIKKLVQAGVRARTFDFRHNIEILKAAKSQRLKLIQQLDKVICNGARPETLNSFSEWANS